MSFMEDKLKPIKEFDDSIQSLLIVWACGFGAIILCIVISLFTPKLWIPLIVVFIAWAQARFTAAIRAKNGLRCSRITAVVSTSLVLSAVVMLCCLLVNRTDLVNTLFGVTGYNSRISFISSLIIFPVTVFVSLTAFFQNKNKDLCNGCINFSPFKQGSLDIKHETSFQLELLIFICLLLGAVNWIYYCLWFSSASINGLDRYIFIIIPVVLFVASLFYLGRRYGELMEQLKYAQSLQLRKEALKVLRFLVIMKNKILLSENKWMLKISLYDTPAVKKIDADAVIDSEMLDDTFRELSGLAGTDIKYLYTSDELFESGQTYHYAAILGDEIESGTDIKLSGKWVTLDEIYRLSKENNVSPELAAEIHRIFTVTMAWKTYTRDGKRLYPIRNYIPTFRLQDIKKWDVNYDDPQWIYISVNNEDKPFYRIKRLINAITGFGRNLS